jgi:hypothetical protein
MRSLFAMMIMMAALVVTGCGGDDTGGTGTTGTGTGTGTGTTTTDTTTDTPADGATDNP